MLIAHISYLVIQWSVIHKGMGLTKLLVYTSCWYKESNNRLVVADQVFEILTVYTEYLFKHMMGFVLLLLMGGFGVWGFVLVFLGGVFAFVLWVVCFFGWLGLFFFLGGGRLVSNTNTVITVLN